MPFLHRTGEVADDYPGARIGGRPLAPAGTPWPTCKTCNGPLRFIAQHPIDDDVDVDHKLLLLFQCENDPGSCNEWAPDGGNAALVVRGALAPMTPPPPVSIAVTFAPPMGLRAGDDDGDGLEDHDAIGRLGGEPDWIQGDETPSCCGTPMRFALQLDENAHRQLNFCGGGAAYAFVCVSCERALYLMQQ
jgi:hypothetical protein